MKDSQKILPTQPTGRTKSFLLLSILIGIAVFLYMQRGNLYAQMDEWKLMPRPERFTELFLENHALLLRSVDVGQVVPFSFTVHNLEGKSMEYRYEIYAIVENEDEKQSIDRGEISLENDGLKVIQGSYTFPENVKKVTVVIELPDLQQKIHFILNT